MQDINEMIEIIKEIDIGKYTQEEYRNVVDSISINFKAKWYDELYDKKGFRDFGGQS
tara:strand:+ start:7268 stop:7438 length:171 start_codon:yes stop_codon:yes gene_type:complete